MGADLLARFSRKGPAMLAEANGARMISLAREIVASDRWNSFDRFHETNRGAFESL